MQPPDPSLLDHLFTRTIDSTPVRFVRPCDTDRPTWAAYEGTRYLGTVHAQFDTGGRWHVQSLRENHLRLDDAVRALRRPSSWPADQERVRQWAHGVLSDPHVVLLDVQTTALAQAWAVQIGMTDRYGNVLLDKLVNPMIDITPAATALHGLSPKRLAAAPTFDAVLPTLGNLLNGRRCLAYNADFDRGVLEREIQRLSPPAPDARAVLSTCSWHDAMAPYAAWKGLWSARHGAYRYQPLGSVYDAIANCRRLLTAMRQMAQPASAVWR